MTDLIVYETKRYRCPHCRRSYGAKGTAERHLERCFRNPSRRTCMTCVHQRKGVFGEPDCAISEGAWPCCAECGNSRRSEGADLDCRHPGQEANYLQVLCPSWEARDDPR